MQLYAMSAQSTYTVFLSNNFSPKVFGYNTHARGLQKTNMLNINKNCFHSVFVVMATDSGLRNLLINVGFTPPLRSLLCYVI